MQTFSSSRTRDQVEGLSDWTEGDLDLDLDLDGSEHAGCLNPLTSILERFTASAHVSIRSSNLSHRCRCVGAAPVVQDGREPPSLRGFRPLPVRRFQRVPASFSRRGKRARSRGECQPRRLSRAVTHTNQALGFVTAAAEHNTSLSAGAFHKTARRLRIIRNVLP